MGCCATQKEEGEFSANILDLNLKDKDLLIIKCQAACRRYLSLKRVQAIKQSRANFAPQFVTPNGVIYANETVDQIERKLGPFNYGPLPEDSTTLE